jgi:hypothetical protein
MTDEVTSHRCLLKASGFELLLFKDQKPIELYDCSLILMSFELGVGTKVSQ